MTTFSITHAYLAVGIAGVVAFVLLLLCGQHNSLASAELGGTEVAAPTHEVAKSASAPKRTAGRAKSTTATLGHAAASVTDLSSGFE